MAGHDLDKNNASLLPTDSNSASVGKLASLGFISCVSLAGNLIFAFTSLKDRSLHRAPYYLMLDLCLGDVIRSLLCFPLVLKSISSGSQWTYSKRTCKMMAFGAALLCFHAAFMLLSISLTRYMAIAHHRFYSKRMKGWACAIVISMAWILSMAMALPPVFEVGTYKFIKEEDQCTFEHRYVKANDSLGFLLMLSFIVGATHFIYMKLLFFIYDHRKMKPAQLTPAISQNWSFHGPGAAGQAAANWIAGFGRGPTPPTLVGMRQTTQNQFKRLLVLEEFKQEKRLSKMFYVITFLFLLLWVPYLVACYLRVFLKATTLPRSYMTVAVWLTFVQAGVNPIVCFMLNKELRVSLVAYLPCKSPQTQREIYTHT
ncbi:probable G-protein coupled receptor 27 [Bombina bombina]|uniref:probable G-protein coupled receptor 27 n=1 Tax=Bombina bombina TaxID=8345 RepID=UPI00235A7EE8|nr:probable G-protein coupled receptor 27 [Bombina bombina]